MKGMEVVDMAVVKWDFPPENGGFRRENKGEVNQGLAKIEVEGNSKLVIDAVNGVSSPPWKLLKLVQDIKALSSSFEFVKFKHVFREANFVAKANLGHMVDNMNLWEECVPPEVFSALTFDVVNIGCVRGTSI
ncbi:hypothetical protein ACLB2K_011048 [Fragaria x ananassa]